MGATQLLGGGATVARAVNDRQASLRLAAEEAEALRPYGTFELGGLLRVVVADVHEGVVITISMGPLRPESCEGP